MPRDASGNYVLPAGNPVSGGTIIASTWANDTMADMGAEMTNSLSRSGQGGMLAPLKAVDGSLALPGYSFLNDTQSGLLLSGPQAVVMTIGGIRSMQWSAAGVFLWNGSSWIPIPENVLPISSDDVTNDSTVSGATVSDSLEYLLSQIQAPIDSTEITNVSTVPGSNVTLALNELDNRTTWTVESGTLTPTVDWITLVEYRIIDDGYTVNYYFRIRVQAGSDAGEFFPGIFGLRPPWSSVSSLLLPANNVVYDVGTASIGLFIDGTGDIYFIRNSTTVHTVDIDYSIHAAYQRDSVP